MTPEPLEITIARLDERLAAMNGDLDRFRRSTSDDIATAFKGQKIVSEKIANLGIQIQKLLDADEKVSDLPDKVEAMSKQLQTLNDVEARRTKSEARNRSLLWGLIGAVAIQGLLSFLSPQFNALSSLLSANPP